MVKFALTLLGSALLATSALSTPSHQENMAIRPEQAREAAPPSDHAVGIEGFVGGNVIVSSRNWGGAVYDTNPVGTFKSVTGTFVVPTPRVPESVSGTYFSASPAVGIDGSSCNTTRLHTGLEMIVSNGQISYNAWYRWFPANTQRITSVTISGGHTVRLTVIATSRRTGAVIIENLSTGQSVSQTISSSTALCQQNASWTVQDFIYEDSGASVPFADFGTVTFTNAAATTGSCSVGPRNATIFDITQDGKVLTSTSPSMSAVTISYTGGD